MALNATALAVIVSLFRAWVGGGAFDRIKHEFDLMSRTGLSGSERRKMVVDTINRELPQVAEAVVLAAIQLLWMQVPAELRAHVEAIGKARA